MRMERVHPLVTLYKQTILGFEPLAFAKMNSPGAEAKYTKIYRPLSNHLIRLHLRGDMTLAVCLVNPAGLARAAVLDIDAGGQAALLSALEKARARRLVAFAQSSATAEHDGGHVWLLFDAWQAPDRFRLLADMLAHEAGIQAESYPTRKAIRLPLGVHRWTGKRGVLFLPDGMTLDLDRSEQAVKTAIRSLKTLPQNSIEQLPPLPIVRQVSPDAPIKRPEAQGGSQNVIRDYNHSVNLITLLERFGGRVSQYFPNDSGALMHCPCPHHQHQDARPSIEVRRAKNPQRYGEYVVYGYSPTCVFYTERGQVVDAFGVYCQMNNLEPDEAVRQLSS